MNLICYHHHYHYYFSNTTANVAIQSDTIPLMCTIGSKIYSGAISISLLGPGGRSGLMADILVEDAYQGLLSLVAGSIVVLNQV